MTDVTVRGEKALEQSFPSRAFSPPCAVLVVIFRDAF